MTFGQFYRELVLRIFGIDQRQVIRGVCKYGLHSFLGTPYR